MVGDDLSVIGSGPTVADTTTSADALDVLSRRSLLSSVPKAVLLLLHEAFPLRPIPTCTGPTLAHSHLDSALNCAATDRRANSGACGILRSVSDGPDCAGRQPPARSDSSRSDCATARLHVRSCPELIPPFLKPVPSFHRALPLFLNPVPLFSFKPTISRTLLPSFLRLRLRDGFGLLALAAMPRCLAP